MEYSAISNYEGFQRLAPYNDTFFAKPNPLKNEEHQLMEKYLKTLQLNGNRHLDVGCGTGDFCFFMANGGYNVTGMDFSDNMLLVARNKLNIFKRDIEAKNHFINNPNYSVNAKELRMITSIVPKIKFLKDDIAAPMLVRERFNLITCLNTLNYIGHASRESAFRSLAQLLFADGHVVLNITTRLGFEQCMPVRDMNEYFDYEINYSYDRNAKINISTYKFNLSQLVTEPFEIKFVEFEHTVGETIKSFEDNGFNIIKIIPNTPVYSVDESNLDAITEAIENTYSIPNGVCSVIFVAQKL